MKQIKKADKRATTNENMDRRQETDSTESFAVKRSHLKSDYPVKDERIMQLAMADSALIPCEISEEEDRYEFVFDTGNLCLCEKIIKEPLSARYRFLINTTDLSSLTDRYSFSLDPSNLYFDIADKPKVLDRSFARATDDFLREYKALCAAVIKGEHSFRDFLEGGDDLYMQDPLLEKIYGAGSIDGLCEHLREAAQQERNDRRNAFVEIPRQQEKRRKILFPIILVVMCAALVISGYEILVKGKHDEKIMDATESYIAEDYGAVCEILYDVNVEKMTDGIRYMTAVSSVRCEGLSAVQKENIIEAINRYKTNDDYLDYWIMIGRQDYEEADQYAQKIRDNEHRVYALALLKAQIEKDPNISGSAKTKKIEDIDEKINGLIESINEEKYGLTDETEDTANSEEDADDVSEDADEKTDDEAAEDEPKLLQ